MMPAACMADIVTRCGTFNHILASILVTLNLLASYQLLTWPML